MGFPIGAKADFKGRDFFDREIGDPYGCYGCAPRFGFYHNRLSCGEARARVRYSGYTPLNAGAAPTPSKPRKGRDVTVFVNARNGAISRR